MGTILIIQQILDLLVVGSQTYEQITAVKAKIDAMHAEGRDPTDAEWAALFDSIKADSDRLAAAAR